MAKNILLTIEYDGMNFHGWQIQPGERTVQGEIEYVLKYIAGEDVHIHGTSRTDAGVHALGQCASFTWDCPIPTANLPMVMNRRFGAGGVGRSGAPGDIRIVDAREVPEDFHARYSCKGKTYRYVIDQDGDIFDRNHVCHFTEPLDIDAIKRAARYIVGTHDFKSFETAGGTPRETTVRTVSELEIYSAGDVIKKEYQDNGYSEAGIVPLNNSENETVAEKRIIIRITGDGFLYNMVRIIVGTLIEIGQGKRSAEEMPEIIAACDRSKAGFTAPPQGLYLEKIYF